MAEKKKHGRAPYPMYYQLTPHKSKTTENTQRLPKILALLIYEVLIDNTLDRARGHVFFFGHPYLEIILPVKWILSYIISSLQGRYRCEWVECI